MASILDSGSQYPIGGPGPGPVVARQLGLQVEKQEYDEWCWAAVAVSVSRYYEKQGTGWRQCDLVDRELGKAVCCQDGDKCNVSWYLERALKTVNHYQTYDPCSPANWQAPSIKREIDADRIPCARIGWRGSVVGHFLAITGYTVVGEPGHQRVSLDISDPRYGGDVKTLRYWEFMLHYETIGLCTHTYFTL